MQIGRYSGPIKCMECGADQHLREVQFKGNRGGFPQILILCGACCALLEKVMQVERERPHMKSLAAQYKESLR